MSTSPASTTSPRIALLLDGDPAQQGATATKFGLFVEELRRQGNGTAVGDLRLTGPMRVAAMGAAWRPQRRAWREHYRKNPLTFLLRSRQSVAWLRGVQPRPDIVLQVGAMSNPAAFRAAPFALYLDFTFALTNREWPARVPMLRSEQAIWIRLERRAYQQAAVIFTRSEYVAASLRADYGIDDAKIVVAHAGVNLPLPDIHSPPTCREPRALFIGSDFERKGGDLVLAAWPKVLERIPNAGLSIVGEPTGRLPESVDVIGSRWDPQRVVAELNAARLFVMPSRCETWGDVFLEAMAYGVPCIGSTNDAMPEIIRDGITGFVVPDGDVTMLADRISVLLANPGLAAQMGLAGRQRVEEQFTWRTVIELMLPVLAGVSAARHASRVD